MIYIVAHKKVQVPSLQKYCLLQVGAEANEIFCELKDNDGDHISSKNKDFCELTGLYWIWKNSTEEYKGLVHYRRFFAKSNLRKGTENIYTHDELVSVLEKADVVVSYRERFLMNAKKELLQQCCTDEIFHKLETIVGQTYPEYAEDFKEFFASNEAVLFNMFFCKNELFDAYCEWLFTILFELEKQIGDAGVEYPPRLYGYLSERLLNVWIRHNHLATFHSGILNTELDTKSRIRLIRRRITNQIRFRLWGRL